MVGDETGASSVSIGVISTHESAIDHMGTHSGGLIEAVQMCTKNIRFHICGVNPSTSLRLGLKANAEA